MTYKMFIDDERDPPNDGAEWAVCRSHFDVADLIYEKNMPAFISFDHDLGENEKTGYDIAQYLVKCDMNDLWVDMYNESLVFPDNFQFYVHSQNPVGKKNIEKYLRNYLEFKKNGYTQ